MKKHLLLIVLFAGIIFTAVPACGDISRNGDSDGTGGIELTKSQLEIIEKGNNFAFSLLYENYRENEGGNLFLSPLGVNIVSCMLANGASGRTYDEIVNTVGFAGYSLQQVNDSYSTVVSELSKADSSVNISLTNSIWASLDLNLKKDFRDNIDKTFKAESFSVDFGSENIVGTINKWCSDKTSGLIPKMFDVINKEVRLILVNALYFQGSWTCSFPEESTFSGSFFTLEGKTAELPFMNVTSDFESYRSSSLDFVKIPYGNGAFEMLAISPASDFEKWLSRLSIEQVSEWDRLCTESQLSLIFPKFTAEYDTEEMLMPVLARLGMKEAFSPLADFSKMSDENLYVDLFRQKTYVSIDEKGTEAAAVTVAELRKNSVSQANVIAFNRPFIYLIREKGSGVILFIGTKVG